MIPGIFVFLMQFFACIVWYYAVEAVRRKGFKINKFLQGILLLGVPAFILLPSVAFYIGSIS